MEKEYIIIYTVKMKYAYHTKWCDKWYRGGANHPHYSVIRATTVSFITPFGMVCTQCRLNKQACMSMQAKWS